MLLKYFLEHAFITTSRRKTQLSQILCKNYFHMSPKVLLNLSANFLRKDARSDVLKDGKESRKVSYQKFKYQYPASRFAKKESRNISTLLSLPLIAFTWTPFLRKKYVSVARMW